MDRQRAIRQFKELKKLGGDMRLAAEGWDEEWKTLVATMMSAQTKDETTIPVAQELFGSYKGVKKLAGAKVVDVAGIIRRVNYHKTKSRNIVACCKILDSKYDGKVPRDVDSLVELPGVGRKTANVFLASLGNSNIGVDTHVHYISNYLGWANSRYPEKTEEQLKELFPKGYWKDLNWVLVRFGKNHTSKRKKNEILDGIKSY